MLTVWWYCAMLIQKWLSSVTRKGENQVFLKGTVIYVWQNDSSIISVLVSKVFGWMASIYNWKIKSVSQKEVSKKIWVLSLVSNIQLWGHSITQTPLQCQYLSKSNPLNNVLFSFLSGFDSGIYILQHSPKHRVNNLCSFYCENVFFLLPYVFHYRFYFSFTHRAW